MEVLRGAQETEALKSLFCLRHGTSYVNVSGSLWRPQKRKCPQSGNMSIYRLIAHMEHHMSMFQADRNAPKMEVLTHTVRNRSVDTRKR